LTLNSDVVLDHGLLVEGSNVAIDLNGHTLDMRELRTYVHDNITFTAWNATDSMPTEAGNYYLANDVTISSTWNVPSGTLNLCLNGYGINAGGSGYSVITVPNGAILNLYDCGTTVHSFSVNSDGLAMVGTGDKAFVGGYITGGSVSEQGGGVYVSGEFTMYGGTLIGNKGANAGGIFVDSGTFTMNGGKILYNTCSYQGAGVYVGAATFKLYGGEITNNVSAGSDWSHSGGVFTQGNATVYIHGAPNVKANIGGDNVNSGKTHNLLLRGNLIIDGELTNTEPIGIRVRVGSDNYGVFSKGTNTTYNVASKFISDNDSYVVLKNADEQLCLESGYTVTFDVNGHGTAPDAQTIISGNKVTKPTDPTDEGYVFDGWYKEEALTNEWDFDNDTVTADTTIYAKWTMNSYTVTFHANNGTDGQTTQTVQHGVATVLTANTFQYEGYQFASWNTKADGTGTGYADGTEVTLTEGIVLYAQWTSGETYDITGVIQQDGNGVNGAVVKLMQGEKSITSAVTDSSGTFQFSAPAGIYNIVVEYGDVTKTELINLESEQSIIVTMPEAGVNSILKVSGSATPDIMVGGLDELAESISNNGTAVTVTMTVEQKAESVVTDAEAIKETAAVVQTLEYFEIALEQRIGDVTTAITDTNEKVLEIVVPYEFNGKEDVVVYRYHNGVSEKLTEVENGGEAKVDGTYWLDHANGLVHIYASKFSTYAIGYTQCYNIDGKISYGSFTGAVTVTLMDKEKTETLSSKSISASSGSDLAGFFSHIRKGEYCLVITWTENGKEYQLENVMNVQ